MSDESTEHHSDPAPDATTSENPPQPEIHSSPGAGCIIIALLFAMIAGIASYGIYSGVRQDKDIAVFASEIQEALPVEPTSHEEVLDTRKRLADFADASAGGKPATLALSARDLNTLVHNESALAQVRGTVFFESIKDDRVQARIALPMNRIAFWKKPRYLNGRAVLAVESGDGRIFFRIESMEIPKATPPEGFVERMAQSDLLAPYKKDDEQKKVFENSNLSARTDNEAGTIIVEATPKE